MATINTPEEFRKLVLAELPAIFEANPQVVLNAMAKNPEALRASLKEMGYIVGDDVKGVVRDTMAAHRQNQAEGITMTGFGIRTRKLARANARRVLDEATGRMRTTYLDDETEELAEGWFRAFYASQGGQPIDPASKEHIGVIYDKLQRAVRAPATPLTPEAGTGGGYLIPLLVAAEVFEYMNERFLLRGMVEVFVSAAPLTIPRRLSQVVVSRFGAGKDTPEVNIAAIIGAAKLSPELVGALTYIDPRLALAAAVGPVRYTIGQLAEALAKDYQRTIVNGNAQVREPRGIAGLPTAGAAVADMAQLGSWDATSNQTKRDSFRKTYYQVGQPHRESSKFVIIANNEAVQVLASVNDVNQQPFTDAKDGQPARYMGKIIVETTAIPTITGSPPTSTLYAGDMGQYAWLESPDGLSMQQTTEGGQAWPSNTIGVKILQSVDGEPVVPQAFMQLPGVN